MSEKPISDLRRRMIQDMTVRTIGDKTQANYIRHVEALAKFLGRSPDTATGRKCSVRPCVPLSIRTWRVAPVSAASRLRNAASPAPRKRFARSLISPPATCGIRAAGVPGRFE